MERAGNHWVIDTVRRGARIEVSALVRVFPTAASSSGARAMPTYRIDAQEERLLALAAAQVDAVIAGPCSELTMGGALTVPIRCKALEGQRYLSLFSIEHDAFICTPLQRLRTNNRFLWVLRGQHHGPSLSNLSLPC